MRTTSEVGPGPPGPLPPVERGTVGAAVTSAAEFVAENEERAAELADEACSTGQTVYE